MLLLLLPTFYFFYFFFLFILLIRCIFFHLFSCCYCFFFVFFFFPFFMSDLLLLSLLLSLRSRHLCTVFTLLYGWLCSRVRLYVCLSLFCWFIPHCLTTLDGWLTGWLVEIEPFYAMVYCDVKTHNNQPTVYNNVYIHNLWRWLYQKQINQTQPTKWTDQIQGKPKSMPAMFALNKITKTIEQRWTHQATKKWRLLQGFIR